MIKLIEIYEDEALEPRDHHPLRQDRNRASKLKPRYNLREVFLNPEYITLMRCDASYQQKLSRGLLVIEELNSMQKFTKVSYVSGNAAREIVAVISVEELVSRVNGSKSLLRG